MKCAFPCLFVLSISQTVFALLDDSGNQFFAIRQKTNSAIYAAAKAVKNKDIKVHQILGTCAGQRNDDAKKYEKNGETRWKQCLDCYNQPGKLTEIKTGPSCCKKIVDKFEKEANSFRDQAVACIKKCDKLGADCGKMIKKDYRQGQKVKSTRNT